MADQGGTNEGQGRVEIGLSFLSAQDSAAFREMKEAFSQAGKMFEAMNASNFVQQATRLAELTAKMNTERERMSQANERDRQMQERGGGIRGIMERITPSGREARAEREREEAQRARDAAAEADKEEKQRVKDRQERQRLDRLDAMSDQQREAERQRRRSPLRTSNPEAFQQIFGSVTDEQQPEGVQRVEPLRGEPTTGLRIPRFGELNIQDLFNELRDRRMREALAAEDPAEAEDLLRRSGNWQQRADRMGEAYGVGQLIRRTRQGMGLIGGVTGFQPLEFVNQGAALGYRRDTNPFSTILGAQTPFSAAGRQGERMWRDNLSMRLQPGINQEQAGQIQNAVAQAGFSGAEGTNLGLDFMAPMMRNFGVDPEALIPFTQQLRTGTGSIEDLNKSLANLGELARTARVDVNTMAQALAASGEAAQQAGGYFQGGVQFGRQFTETTGLTPDVGNQLMQNNTVQALLAGQTGLPTFAQAAAPAGAKVQATRDAVNMYYRAYAGALGEEGATRTVDLGNGRTAEVRGDNPASASVGAMLGINADQVDKIRMGQDFQTNVGNLEDTLTAYEQQGDRRGGTPRQMQDRAVRWAQARGQRYDRNTGKFSYKQVDETTGEVTWREDERNAISKQFSEEVGAKAMKELEKDPASIHRDDLVRAAHRAGIKGKELGKAIDDAKTPEERVKRVRALIAERTAEEQAKYQIAFTGPAKKLFKALVKDAGGNYEKDWNAPANTGAGSTPGQAPLTPGGNTGVTPTDFNTGSE